MSDTHSGSAAPPDDAPPPSSADATIPAPLSVDCPGCGAKLRNVAAEPGAKIRCLNCGTRFVAIPAAAEAAGSPRLETDSDDDAKSKPFMREPQSAGYWILRIPAMIFALFSVLGFGALCYAIVHDLRRGYGPGSVLRSIQPFLYFPLLPLAGFLAFRVTRALARVEAGTIKAAWQGGLLRAPLPAARGSSLPYILPLAAAPAVTLLVILVGSLKSDYRRADDTIPFFLAIPFFFLLGFMCDDLRQFIWRQQALADSCAQNAGGSVSKSRAAFPWLGLLLALTLGLFASALLCNFASEYTKVRLLMPTKGRTFYYYDYDVDSKYSFYEAMGMTSASLLCAIVTLFLLARNFRRAVAAWWDAGQALPSRGGEAAFARQAIDVPMLVFRCAVYVFLLALVPIMIRGVTRHQSFDTAHIVWEFVGGCFALCATVMLALALMRLLADVRQWRKAQTQFWMLRGGPPLLPVLSTPVRLAVFGTLALMLLQAVIFALIQIDRLSGRTWSAPHWEDWMMELPIALFAVHAPIVWALLFSREFLLTEQMASKLSAGEAQ